ncbi:hypothetical protein HDU90_005131 [Geranomyces variabilis]|nr:hypothetical protein HDU90_005131 [Geranomyces variabilis]
MTTQETTRLLRDSLFDPPIAQVKPVPSDAHSCDGSHSGSSESNGSCRKLLIATALCFLFFAVELFAGLWAGSLAILSDSFHLLSDIAGFAISLTAIYLSERPATRRHSFGFHRTEILGAILSTFLIWILTAFLLWAAVDRLRNPVPIDGPVMFGTAAVGVVVNIILGLTLHGFHNHSHGGHSHGGHSHGGHAHDHSHAHSEDDHAAHAHDHKHDLSHVGGITVYGTAHVEKKTRKVNINIESATIHVLGDLLSSLGVLIAATVIWIKPEYTIVDPICTCFFSCIVLATTMRLMYNSIAVLMEGTPDDIDANEVQRALAELPGVHSVHELHIWNLTVGKPSLTVHLSLSANHPQTPNDPMSTSDTNAILLAAQTLLCVRFDVHHATIQLEHPANDGNLHCSPFMCRTAPDQIC